MVLFQIKFIDYTELHRGGRKESKRKPKPTMNNAIITVMNHDSSFSFFRFHKGIVRYFLLSYMLSRL